MRRWEDRGRIRGKGKGEIKEELTKYGEGDVTFQDRRIVSRLTGITSGVRGSNLLRVNRLIRALRIKDKMALTTWPRISPIIFVPGTCEIRKKIYKNYDKILLSF